MKTRKDPDVVKTFAAKVERAVKQKLAEARKQMQADFDRRLAEERATLSQRLELAFAAALKELPPASVCAVLSASGIPLAATHVEASTTASAPNGSALRPGPPAAARPAGSRFVETMWKHDALRGKLAEHRGNVKRVAKDFGKERVQIYRWMKAAGISADEFRE